MTSMWSRSIAALVLALAPSLAPAQELGTDEGGCVDSKLLSRMPGCSIMRCDAKEFDAMTLTVGVPDPQDGTPNERAFEGETEELVFLCPAKLSSLQIVRNAASALRTAGFTLVYESAPGVDPPLVTGSKSGVWVSVYGEPWNDYSGYVFRSVRTQAMKQELVADASALAAEIARSGHVAVYGINFASGKATLEKASEPVLAQVKALLEQNAEWKLRIEGHTDSTGTPAANLKLSAERAAAVVEWLAAHGIARERLEASGLGDTRPLADNKTEEGKAKNRRVELVKK